MGSAVKRRGKLIVFEGPDGVGKSTICRAVAAALEKLGESCVLMSFPGQEEGTLGEHVYALHHNLPGHGITFDGHPDLRRIYLYEEFVGYPLRKDYPKEKRQPLVRRDDLPINPVKRGEST